MRSCSDGTPVGVPGPGALSWRAAARAAGGLGPIPEQGYSVVSPSLYSSHSWRALRIAMSDLLTTIQKALSLAFIVSQQ